MFALCSSQINLYVKITKTIAMKVRDLKETLLYKTDITEEDQELFFAGANLKDDHRLSDYDILGNSTVHLVHGQSSATKLCVWLPCREEYIELPVKKGYTVQKLKSMIQHKGNLSI